MKAKILALILLLGLFYSTIFSVNTTQVTPIYYKLYYDGFDVNGNPRFICQNCKFVFYDARVSTVKATLINKITDVNTLVVFKCPKCGAEYRLFVALHKYPNGSVVVCIQKSSEEGAGGISSNWWQTSVNP
jgi:rubredoxin